MVSLPLPSEVSPTEVRGGGSHSFRLSDAIPRKIEADQSQTVMLSAHTPDPLNHSLSLTHRITSPILSSSWVPKSLGRWQTCNWDKHHVSVGETCLMPCSQQFCEQAVSKHSPHPQRQIFCPPCPSVTSMALWQGLRQTGVISLH